MLHSPPYGTKLDVLYNRQPAGSRAIRHFLAAQQPALSLHGHIHESPRMSGAYLDRLGRTLCVNPGQDHDRPHFVSLDTADIPATIEHSVFKF